MKKTTKTNDERVQGERGPLISNDIETNFTYRYSVFHKNIFCSAKCTGLWTFRHESNKHNNIVIPSPPPASQLGAPIAIYSTYSPVLVQLSFFMKKINLKFRLSQTGKTGRRWSTLVSPFLFFFLNFLPFFFSFVVIIRSRIYVASI